MSAGAVRAQTPVSLASVAFARAYVTTMRPYLLFVSGITGIVGMALVPGVPAGAALGLGFAFFLSYGFGQALTDCFQIDTDSISAPYRPLVQGIIRPWQVAVISVAGLAAVGIALVAAHPWNLPLVVACIAGLSTYTWFKRHWWAGPFYNAWIVAALMFTGVLAGIGAGGAYPRSALALAGTGVAVFFGYSNFVLTGYFKDISADRLTGYGTLPVRAGRSVSCVVSDGFALIAVAGTLLAAEASGITARGATADVAFHQAAGVVVSVLLVGAGILASALAQIRLHSVRRDDDAHFAIVPAVHAYVLLLTGIAVAHRPGWTLALLSFAAMYLVTMYSRPVREQI